MKKNLFTYSVIFLLYAWANHIYGNVNPYIFSKIDYQQGLSNSAVLCMFQDQYGLMWFGTYDGINCYDSKSMEVYRSDFSTNKTLNNNIISSIKQADNNNLWISTHLGVSRFSLLSRQVISNYEFSDDYSLHSNSKGNTWVIGKGWIKYYNINQKKFIEIGRPNYKLDNIESRAYVADDGSLWVFPSGTGCTYHYTINSFGASPGNERITVTYAPFHHTTINYLYYQRGVLCFIDANKELYIYDTARKSKIYIRNISALMQKYGEITGIIPFYDDIMIAFRTNGLFRLQASQKYEESIIDRNIRIFNIYKDAHQDILWIGSDGKGVISYSKKHAVATNIMLKQLSPNLSRQVRSIMADKYGNLWFGTKGDGMICIKNYNVGIRAENATIYSPNNIQKALSYEKWDNEFQVYALRQSRYRNGFWIGSGTTGLFYYSFTNSKLQHVNEISSPSTTEIHAIYEANDTTLYLATSGLGLRKMILNKGGETVSVKSLKQFRFFYEQKELNMFYSMVSEGDSILWLGSREKGLVRFDMRTNEYKVISLKEMLRKAVDDILSLCISHNGKLYIGTTSGLVLLSTTQNKMKAQYVGREQGLLNDMIHGVLEDKRGFLWLSTNKGLIKYNPINGFTHAYYYSSGIQIGEYSDDAYYKCPYSGNLFFGGIDGLLYINENTANNTEYYPNILLRKLSIGAKEANLVDYYNKNQSGLVFKGNNISFALDFIAPDYVTGSDIEYSYMLEGFDNKWSAFSSLNEASYSSLPVGKYVFKVRYKKDVFNTEYKYFELPIHVLPLWYQTIFAKLIYLLLGIILTVYFILLILRYLKQEKDIKVLQEAERNNVIGPFSSLQNKDCTNSLTTIYAACNHLRTNNDMSLQERQQVADLICETMMFSSLSSSYVDPSKNEGLFIPIEYTITGNIKIKNTSEKVINYLKQSGIDTSMIHTEIPDELHFSVYKNAIRIILYFCYWFIAHNKLQGTIVRFAEQDGQLIATFIADNKALLNKLSQTLSGDLPLDMGQTSSADSLFRIRILHSSMLMALKQWKCKINYQDITSSLSIAFNTVAEVNADKEKPIVLLLESRDGMIWLITELLNSTYSVKSIKNIQQAFQFLKETPPSAFIVDMMMYADAEDKFIEYIKENHSHLANTAFIPMLNWKIDPSIQKKLILWADAYMTLPYDIPYIKEITLKSIYGKGISQQISIENIGNFIDKTTYANTEQADFMKKVLLIINKNIDKEDIGSSFIASQMAMSSRQFYRKFKDISSLSPSDLIKNARMEKAAELLSETSLSIQEVISEVGIVSRSYFYKEFMLKYGVTPKDYRKIKKEAKEKE